MPPSNGQTKRAPVPVTIVTGFLGSGKTTLLNHILKSNDHGMRFAVIENELGDIGVDDELVSGTKAQLVEEEIIEVMNGCICCAVRGDLLSTLNKLYNKVDKFDGLIIETTGMADPAPVVQTFFIDHLLRYKYRLDSVIAVVDATQIRDRLADSALPGREEGIVNESLEQIAFSDKVLLNKTDLVKDEAELLDIERQIRQINQETRILRTSYCTVHPKEILNVNGFHLSRALEYEPELLDDIFETKHDSRIGSISLKIDGEMNLAMLEKWIQLVLGGNLEKALEEIEEEEETELVIEDVTHFTDEEIAEMEKEDEEESEHDHSHSHSEDQNAMKLYRYKGIFAAKGIDNKFLFQGVNMMYERTLVDVKWGPHEKRECRMVFIGRNLKTDFLKAGFENCKVTEELRFDVGTKVLANVGYWAKAEVIAHWNDGNPYRVRLENQEGREVFAPVDEDEYIRAR